MNQQAGPNSKMKTAVEPKEVLELGKLSNSLGFLTRMAQIEIFDSFHSELAEYDLKPGEFSVFWLVGLHPGIRQGLVAGNLRIKQAHMTKLVRGLEKRGLLSRVVPDSDRRSVLLDTTDEGRIFLDKIQDDFFSYSISKKNLLTSSETKTLIRLLQKFTGIQESVKNEL